ncbi:E6 protein [Cervus elaphus papillomavirus 2]|uniref:Protein E6 n=1 Tax=Cervus elaphus papillomavirus 2 TaxID=1747359 RepID=A0A1I9KHY4_9PAPI|nr:E6 protein [Cervus elaphus papillomavirus 2]ALP46945.1 E6 protein [Cervus elaphus papillomavirus 2]
MRGLCKGSRMEQPRTIRAYAAFLKIPFEDCLVQCRFCNKFLDFLELCGFEDKRLQLIWRDSFVYGICACCAKENACKELSEYYEFSLTLKDLLKKRVHLGDLIVRCLRCLRLLSYLEKLDLLSERKPVHRVRGSWRGVCRFCCIVR